ncbi:MAG: CDGSH iron-sulfur domain-containing protein [Sedimentibacter sp.]
MSNDKSKYKITIIKDGPYIVSGNIPLVEKIIYYNGRGYEYKDGREFPQSKQYSLCRCGKSKNPPFCDGTHVKCNFDGTETASKTNFLDRIESKIEGPALDLLDDGRCAFARFCHRENGDVWELTEKSDNLENRDEAIKGAYECPAGRLVALTKSGDAIEPEYEPSVEILQDSEMKVSGPIFVKGNIPIKSSNGYTYEIRNRVTLCRCGKSDNKPFCDSKHVSTGYLDNNRRKL